MANKPTEALREPGTSTFQGPVIGDANYVRNGSRVPPGGNVRLNAPVTREDEAPADEPKNAEKKAPAKDAEAE